MSKPAQLKTTKRGKTVLGPLSVAQLSELLTKTSRPRDRARILNRIDRLASKLAKQQSK